ncbi:MAG: hypothetical protein HY816_04020 [Candidatus Wallbacteria bacterium]|nr:hypothetical protein [Candidatus Wallbacteria bacterium]
MIGSHVASTHSVRFRFHHDHAANIAVAGDFSGWQPLEMKPVGGGDFDLEVDALPEGDIQYKFLTPTGWAYDPHNYRRSPDGMNSTVNLGGARGELHYRRLHSPILAADVDYLTYLPPCYAMEGARAYPVLLLMGNLLEESTDWVDRVQMHEHLDELMHSGAIQPMIVVMPGRECFSANVEPWVAHLEFLTGELLDHVGEEFRTLGLHGAEGIGHGGLWSLRAGLTAPARFPSVSCLSAMIPQYLWTTAEKSAPALLEAGARLRLACGSASDELIRNNQAFADHLARLGVSCELAVNEGENDWDLWARQLQFSLGFHDFSFRKRW